MVTGRKISKGVFFKLFDTQIQPMLNYGAEVWGLEADLKIIERVHLFALKRFLNVSVRTSTILVYGETGRYPLFINIYMKCVRYWLRIQSMSSERYTKKAYKMLLYMHEQGRHTWASSLCYLMYKYGFDEAWESQGVGNQKAFLKLFKERLVSRYNEEWNYNLHNNERYKVYRTFKSDLALSPYLVDLKHVKARSYLIRLRLSVSQINTHRLKFSGVNNTHLDCPFCKNVVESEVHFLLVCPAYTDIRNMYIPNKFFSSPCL